MLLKALGGLSRQFRKISHVRGSSMWSHTAFLKTKTEVLESVEKTKDISTPRCWGEELVVEIMRMPIPTWKKTNAILELSRAHDDKWENQWEYTYNGLKNERHMRVHLMLQKCKKLISTKYLRQMRKKCKPFTKRIEPPPNKQRLEAFRVKPTVPMSWKHTNYNPYEDSQVISLVRSHEMIRAFQSNVGEKRK